MQRGIGKSRVDEAWDWAICLWWVLWSCQYLGLRDERGETSKEGRKERKKERNAFRLVGHDEAIKKRHDLPMNRLKNEKKIERRWEKDETRKLQQQTVARCCGDCDVGKGQLEERRHVAALALAVVQWLVLSFPFFVPFFLVNSRLRQQSLWPPTDRPRSTCFVSNQALCSALLLLLLSSAYRVNGMMFIDGLCLCVSSRWHVQIRNDEKRTATQL